MKKQLENLNSLWDSVTSPEAMPFHWGTHNGKTRYFHLMEYQVPELGIKILPLFGYKEIPNNLRLKKPHGGVQQLIDDMEDKEFLTLIEYANACWQFGENFRNSEHFKNFVTSALKLS